MKPPPFDSKAMTARRREVLAHIAFDYGHRLVESTTRIFHQGERVQVIKHSLAGVDVTSIVKWLRHQGFIKKPYPSFVDKGIGVYEILPYHVTRRGITALLETTNAHPHN